jgi:CheY-like chemotaxis protein
LVAPNGEPIVDKARILVVEDDPIVSTDILMTLIRAGYPVCEVVSSGEDAIEAAGRLLPDLVLMDVNVAGSLNGVDTARVLSQRYAVPSLFVSGEPEDLIERSADFPHRGLLRKPFMASDLTDQIHAATSSPRSLN